MQNLDRGNLKALTKKAAVAAWRKNKLLKALCLVSTFAFNMRSLPVKAASPAKAASETSSTEQLRSKIFKGSEGTANCRTLKTDPRGQIGLDPRIDQFIADLIRAIRTKDALVLQPMFHPRLNTGLFALKEALAKIDATFGGPLDVSIYRLWAINTVDGSAKGLECVDDKVTVYPHYGYSLEFGLWLQVMGQKEVGRIFTTIVPVEDKWYLGSFQSQQWTHAGKDPSAWIDDAAKDVSKGLKESAYVKYDIASKLLESGLNLKAVTAADVAKDRDALFNKKSFGELIHKLLPNKDVAYAATMLVTDGAGVLVRMHSPGEISLVDMKVRCRKIADTLAKQPWTSSLVGVRCAYLMPGEKGEFDGGMGSLFVPFKDS